MSTDLCWKRTSPPVVPNSLSPTRYESIDGRFVIVKEFFAAGPSMFDWTLTDRETGEAWNSGTKRKCVQKAERIVDGF